MSENLLQQGIIALRAKRKDEARRLLEQVVQSNPDSEQGWLWLSGAVDTPEERRFCMGQILAINPNNSQAQKGLKALGPGSMQSPVFQKKTRADTPVKIPEKSPSQVTQSYEFQDAPRHTGQQQKRSCVPYVFGLLALVILAGLAFYFLGSGSNSIIGTWKHTQASETFHFYPGGTVVLDYCVGLLSSCDAKGSATGTYRFVEGKQLQMSFPFPVGQINGEVQIQGDAMTFRQLRYRRISRSP